MYYVYMLKTLKGFKNKTYVGYTADLNSRIKKHNSSKGAKATRGYQWKVIFKKKFISKSKGISVTKSSSLDQNFEKRRHPKLAYQKYSY